MLIHQLLHLTVIEVLIGMNILICLVTWQNGWQSAGVIFQCHDAVIKWKHFPRYWPFVPGNHRSPVSYPPKGQWRGALMFSLICDWRVGWVNTRKACALRRYRAHCDVIVIHSLERKPCFLIKYLQILHRFPNENTPIFRWQAII